MQGKKFKKLNFSQRFCDLLKSSGMSQKQLAVALGVSEASVVNYKRGQLPKAEELLRMAQFFDVSMEYLLTGDDHHEIPDAQWRQRAVAAEEKLTALKAGLHAFLKKF